MYTFIVKIEREFNNFKYVSNCNVQADSENEAVEILKDLFPQYKILKVYKL